MLTARSEAKLEAVAQRCRELGAAEVVVRPADLSTKEGCKGLVAAAAAALGGIDVLVLNQVLGFYEDWAARVLRGGAAGRLDDEMAFVDRIFQVNARVYCTLVCCSSVLPWD